MTRPILAATLAAALALPSLTTPARAEIDGGDVARILGGIATVYVLREALRDRDRDRRRDHARPAPRKPVARIPVHRHPRADRPVHRRDVRLLPDHCLRSVPVRGGYVDGYGARCLQNAVARPGLLPARCLEQVRAPRGLRQVYNPRCLRHRGWSPRTARR